MDVRAFIDAEIAKPFAWGATDCVATLDRWVQAAAGVSPLDRYGYRHHDQAGARAILAAHDGDLIGALTAAMAAAGLERTTRPLPGDVGVVRVEDMACAAILTHRLWFSRDQSGVIWAARPRTLRAWRVPCLHS